MKKDKFCANNPKVLSAARAGRKCGGKVGMAEEKGEMVHRRGRMSGGKVMDKGSPNGAKNVGASVKSPLSKAR